jgi:hypothetical protein
MVMITKLDYIESRLQNLIEKTSRFFANGQGQHPLAHQMIEAMKQSFNTGTDGQVVATENYSILVNPLDYAGWQANAGLLDSLSQVLLEAASETGIIFLNPPEIQLVIDSNVPLNSVRVVAQLKAELPGPTDMVTLDESLPSETDPRPSNAFLIVNGEIFPLRLVVINIGRRQDNHLVIEDPRVSRTHAQLRAVHSQYILFDLDSTGGTFLNGQRVSQHTLRPGDVISLAGFPLIFGQDTKFDPTEKISNNEHEEPNAHTAPLI